MKKAKQLVTNEYIYFYNLASAIMNVLDKITFLYELILFLELI
jgi:hypothetical protein